MSIRASNRGDVPALGLFQTWNGSCSLRLGHPVAITDKALELMAPGEDGEEPWPLLEVVTREGLAAIKRRKDSRRPPFETAVTGKAHRVLHLEVVGEVLPDLETGIGIVKPSQLLATGLRTATVPGMFAAIGGPCYPVDFTRLCDPVVGPFNFPEAPEEKPDPYASWKWTATVDQPDALAP